MRGPNGGRAARTLVAALGGAALAAGAIGAGSALAGEEAATKASAPAPPYTKRCAVELRAYGDGSANVYCAERAKPFASVDAETGRIRFYR